MVPEDGAFPERSDAGVNNEIADDWEAWERSRESIREPSTVGRRV